MKGVGKAGTAIKHTATLGSVGHSAQCKYNVHLTQMVLTIFNFGLSSILRIPGVLSNDYPNSCPIVTLVKEKPEVTRTQVPCRFPNQRNPKNAYNSGIKA